ncbi:MAG: outer membrane receptor for ferrienterochelin and colicins, partial [Flavobacteriales bacterium]
MKHLITILLFILVGSGFSQNYKVIVVDVSNKVIPFVNTQVTYEFNNQKKELQTLSNGEGVLFIDTNWINVKLKLKHVSYQTKFSTVNSKNKKVMMYLDNTELTTFVVTGQYSSSSVDESVHKVKVIDSKRIEAQGAVNLQELMEQEMNVRVSQDNTLGSSMSIQGLSGENVKILIDGVPVVGRMNGSIDLSQINLNNIERVEIVEGPLSVNYGTNALAGTINLITKKNKKKFGARAEGYYETIGQYNFNASVDLAIKSHAFTFSGGRNFFDGYSEVDTSRVQQWRPKEQLFGAIKYSNTY